MTLQAQQVDLAHAQEARIRRAMRRMATGAAFRLHRYMFVHERASCISVAFHARCISVGQAFDLAESRSAVNVVAIAAVDQPFVDTVVIRPGKLGFGSRMA